MAILVIETDCLLHNGSKSGTMSRNKLATKPLKRSKLVRLAMFGSITDIADARSEKARF